VHERPAAGLRAAWEATGVRREPVRVPKREGDIRASFFDCRRAERELGRTATTSLEEGLRALVAWRRASPQ
jgi:nucleoside-diphosphate-sugar epimerase